ncbi:hypothetical protein [Pantoea sp.]|uniref:hypothetical protein n=1 Tax=Pantoea sp. TaxID=69393 RepID=UPI0028AD66A9|nr:hypothetical protein [Pantoea sp.]
MRQPAAWLSDLPHPQSDGKRQRATIGMALLTEPPLWIAGEPASSLDRLEQQPILRLYAVTAAAALFISHEHDVVRALCHPLIVLRQGKIVGQGECEQLITSPATADTRALLQAMPVSQQ